MHSRWHNKGIPKIWIDLAETLLHSSQSAADHPYQEYVQARNKFEEVEFFFSLK